MFLNAPDEIIRHPDIQGATGLADKDVNPGTHLFMMDCRVRPGNDEVGAGMPAFAMPIFG